MDALINGILIFGGFVVIALILRPTAREFRKKTGKSLLEVILIFIILILGFILFGIAALGSIKVGMKENNAFWVVVGFVFAAVDVMILISLISAISARKGKGQNE